jgi:hypothetical protein
MLRIKESGIGKMWCGDEIIHLTAKLSQAKLKKLLKRNCEFVEEYEKETTGRENDNTESSAQSKSTTNEEKEDTGNGSNNRRKRGNGKRGKKH